MNEREKLPYAAPTIVELGTVAELTAKLKGAKCVGSGDFLLEGLQERNEISPICPTP
jgi:hypothetical protein